ncbi:MAG: hypothetical protein GTO18_01155 [Anaerolineales bacterium]|nr:hypothetical protein [Anaerolineales bacterium]
MDEVIDYLFIGGMREDYCITHDGKVHLGVLGGNAIYAASGARLWSSSVGIVSRVGSNYPHEWLDLIQSHGINVRGIKILSEEMDTRNFYVYVSEEERIDTNPAAHFLRIGHPLPKELMDYQSSTEGQSERTNFTPIAIRPDDLLHQGSYARAAHISPSHYLSHITIPVRLRELMIRLITLDPSERYMEPGYKDELPVILHGLDVFLPSESEARAFFRPNQLDVWEMAEAFGEMGCRVVIIKCGNSGQFIWDRASEKRWHIPAYPAKVVDVTGAGDAFCGGFLVGYDRTTDPVEAALMGSISASITIEGIGPLYLLGAAPDLAEVRMEALRSSVREL